MRDIDNLIAAEPDLALRNFAQGSYTLPGTGSQQHRCFDMNRDGFTLLAMGFTGGKVRLTQSCHCTESRPPSAATALPACSTFAF